MLTGNAIFELPSSKFTYHWFWGVRIKKDPDQPSIYDELTEYVMDYEKLCSLRLDVRLHNDGNIIARLFRRLFNIGNINKKLVLLKFYEEDEQSQPKPEFKKTEPYFKEEYGENLGYQPRPQQHQYQRQYQSQYVSHDFDDDDDDHFSYFYNNRNHEQPKPEPTTDWFASPDLDYEFQPAEAKQETPRISTLPQETLRTATSLKECLILQVLGMEACWGDTYTLSHIKDIRNQKAKEFHPDKTIKDPKAVREKKEKYLKAVFLCCETLMKNDLNIIQQSDLEEAIELSFHFNDNIRQANSGSYDRSRWMTRRHNGEPVNTNRQSANTSEISNNEDNNCAYSCSPLDATAEFFYEKGERLYTKATYSSPLRKARSARKPSAAPHSVFDEILEQTFQETFVRQESNPWTQCKK